jgi:hypothetical protein
MEFPDPIPVGVVRHGKDRVTAVFSPRCTLLVFPAARPSAGEANQWWCVWSRAFGGECQVAGKGCELQVSVL